MFRKMDDFYEAYKHTAEGTGKVMEALTDESLSKQVIEGHRTLGQMAWHIITSAPEMMGRTGLGLSSVGHETPPPATAAEFADSYGKVSRELVDALKAHWTDETLLEVDDMYGMQWPRGVTLGVLESHEVHHRGQMTVLMRQAGLTVPSIMGPAKEEWAKFGMEEPPL